MHLLKTLLFILSILIPASAYAAEQSEGEKLTGGQKILIAYYSLSGNTREVAEAIQKATGGDLFEIETIKSYPEDYNATTKQAKQEIADGYRPALKGKIADMAQYDVIFIGSPNWWGTITPAVSSFLADNNLEGKTVIPFITHGGGGEQNTISDLTAQCDGCQLKEGWVGYGSRTFGIAGWLKDGGFIK